MTFPPDNESDSSATQADIGSRAPEKLSPSSNASVSTLIDAPAPQPATKWLVGLILDDRYFIEKELGQGGMATVYLARDRKLHDKPVVVKVLLEKSLQHERILQKFEQEKEALARVDHPGIIGILDTGKLPDGNPYIVMQYVAGITLRSAMRPEGMELESVARIIKQLGNALAAAHEKGILHRDLKPENIMLQVLTGGEEQVRIIDFGIAKVKDSLVALTTITPTTLGTYGYMSPEQFHGERVAAVSDIYSLGVIAYEMVTGRRPFNPETVAQVSELHRQGVKIKPRDLRPALPKAAQEIILTTLSFNPGNRCQNAREFGDSLAQALTTAGEISLADLSKKALPTSKGKLRTRTITVISASVIMAVALAAVWANFWRSSVGPTSAKPAQPGVPAKSSATNRVGMKFVYLPPGSFLMGSNNGDRDEQPVRPVMINESFYIAPYEVTQAQWQAVMGANPSYFKGADRPVDNVSWDEVQEFLKKLNAMNDGYNYRLPTESEWEYACRAGTAGDFAGDLDLMAWYANNSGRQRLDADELWSTNRDDYARKMSDNGNETHPVGQKQPNAFGLYDMHGNAWEWCADYYHESYDGAPTDGNAWLSGGDMKYRVLRGGSRASILQRCRCAVRKLSIPGGHGNDVGFRVVAETR